MADRYQNRPHPGDGGQDRGDDPHASGKGESDPLAELARLIGQTDPFGTMGRANQQVPPRSAPRQQYQPPDEPYDEAPPAGPPSWMQRANRQEIREPEPETPPDYPSAVHPLQRYATTRSAAPEPEYDQAPYDDTGQESDPSRYDDALYGQVDTGAQQPQYDAGYADDGYGYQDEYSDSVEEQLPKRRGRLVTVVVILALAVIGMGAAFAYRTYVVAPRSGEPPIIRADAGPTKVVPAPADGTAKVPDRMATGDGTEKIVPREEAPVDVNAKAAPRMVLPPLNQNGNPPQAATATPASPPAPAAVGNGTLPDDNPRKIKTLTVHGDQPDPAAVPVNSAAAPAKPAPRTAAAPKTPPSAANAPLSLVPGDQPAPAAEPHARVATTTPVQTAPVQIEPNAPASGGGYMVQVSSQRNEADAQASYKALQGKFPAVLGSHSPVIKRADLGGKGVYYRALVGPFGTPDEASQFCGNLKTAGGQCVVQRN